MLAAIVPYFNFPGFKRPLENHRRFRETFRGCDLFVIECHLGEPETEADWCLRAGDRHVLWQKEALINEAVRRLPAGYDAVAWIDGDFFFCNPDWRKETERALEETPIAQLYERVLFSDQRGKLASAKPSIASRVRDTGRLEHRNIAPGGVWAARREWLERFWLPDNHVVGGGDSLFAHAALGVFDGDLPKSMNVTWRRDWLAWAADVYRDVNGRVGCVRGDVVHFWHGERKDRQYRERVRCLTDHGYDPRVDIRRESSGLVAWASEKPAMHAAVRDYFVNRREDG